MEGTKNIPRLKFRFGRNCCSIFRLPTFATVSSLTILKKHTFFISTGSNDVFTLQKKFASKGEHMFIYPLEATPHNI